MAGSQSGAAAGPAEMTKELRRRQAKADKEAARHQRAEARKRARAERCRGATSRVVGLIEKRHHSRLASVQPPKDEATCWIEAGDAARRETRLEALRHWIRANDAKRVRMGTNAYKT